MIHDTAYAKLNLALHVRRRRDDGYHELETLFAFVDAGDRLGAQPADHFSLTVTGPFAGDLSAGDDNLVLRAARLLAARNGVTGGIAFTLDKRLPIASGIGGGSADAAAALRLAARLWGDLAVRPTDIAAELGADVPACIVSQTCFGSGVGEQLIPLDAADLRGAPVLLVNPRLACPTGPVFRAWDGVDRGPLDPADWLNARNDLQAPAVALVPAIEQVLTLLATTGARLVRMSGSGATCFALYDHAPARDRAAAQVAAARPDWWQLAGALR
jgi:4-diphosphocytidyl-2-C-methyl-D-erythritol kinase